jgi:hypothetical protein
MYGHKYLVVSTCSYIVEFELLLSTPFKLGTGTEPGTRHNFYMYIYV